MKKLIIIIILILITIIGCCKNTYQKSISNVKVKVVNNNSLQLADEMYLLEIYDVSELTLKILQNRNGALIIEKCIGVVKDSEGSGVIINNKDFYIDYNEDVEISYRNVDSIKKGDVILTYFIYNPSTNYEDDIIARFDYVIDHINNLR